ncbi:MAG: NUDIX hydrolase [Methanobacteriota archaeon]|nr:MAG: NUDIX hydrolase [Euryarchaeota archaeon]
MGNDACSHCGRDSYRSPSVAVDAVALRGEGPETEVLLIRRGQEPYKGMWAFPGGFVDYGEDPEDAVIRELEEEAGVDGFDPVALSIHGDPDRDPRKHVIALFYLVEVDPESVPVAGDDASHAEWRPLDQITEEEISGDHIRIVEMLRD